MPRNALRPLAPYLQKLRFSRHEGPNVKTLAYKATMTLLLDVVLPVAAFFSGYRPGKRRAAAQRA